MRKAREAVYRTYTCSECGATFEGGSKLAKFCPACKRKHMVEANRRRRAILRQQREAAGPKPRAKGCKYRCHATGAYYEPISNHEIRSAKVRPRGCSEVRWRIELRRRASELTYAFGIPVR